MYYEAGASHRQSHHEVPYLSEGALLPSSAQPIRKMGGTLEHGLELTRDKRWKGKRSVRSNVASVGAIFAWLHERGVHEFTDLHENMMPDLIEHLGTTYKSATVSRKMACFRVVCIEAGKAGLWRPTFVVPTTPTAPTHTWYLTAERAQELIAWLKANPTAGDMADLVAFVYLTGVRVEEALRLTRRHMMLGEKPRAKVPGTKNASSVRLIPLSREAAALMDTILKRRPADQDATVFEGNYKRYMTLWVGCRMWLGETDPTCTLKALRRSFAASMVDREMPIELISTILGHADIKTTMGYLRLVGNFMGERARKWLD